MDVARYLIVDSYLLLSSFIRDSRGRSIGTSELKAVLEFLYVVTPLARATFALV